MVFLRDVCYNVNQRMSNYLELFANTRQLAVILSFVDTLSSAANNYDIEFFNYI